MQPRSDLCQRVYTSQHGAGCAILQDSGGERMVRAMPAERKLTVAWQRGSHAHPDVGVHADIDCGDVL